MKRATCLWILSLAVSLAMANPSHAQLRTGFPLYRQTYVPRPMFSPYLNLFRNDAPLFLNYYGLVEPQFQAQAAIGQLQQGVSNLQDSSMAGKELTMPATGSARAGFQTSSSYFMTLGGPSGGRTFSRGLQSRLGQQGGISSGGGYGSPGGGLGGGFGVGAGGGAGRGSGTGVGAGTSTPRR